MTQTGAIAIVVRSRNGDGSLLDIAVTNETAAPLVVSRSGLPWTNSYDLLLTAVCADPVGSVIERSLPVDDPLVGALTVLPGQTVSGEINLTQRFPGLAEARERADVLLYWSWRPRPVNESAGPWSSGWLLLKRTNGD